MIKRLLFSLFVLFAFNTVKASNFYLGYWWSQGTSQNCIPTNFTDSSSNGYLYIYNIPVDSIVYYDTTKVYMQVDFGDGSFSTPKLISDTITNSTNNYQYLYDGKYVGHTWANAGTYSVRIRYYNSDLRINKNSTITTFTVNGGCNSLEIQGFYDENENCIKDVNETLIVPNNQQEQSVSYSVYNSNSNYVTGGSFSYPMNPNPTNLTPGNYYIVFNNGQGGFSICGSDTIMIDLNSNSAYLEFAVRRHPYLQLNQPYLNNWDCMNQNVQVFAMLQGYVFGDIIKVDVKWDQTLPVVHEFYSVGQDSGMLNYLNLNYDIMGTAPGNYTAQFVFSDYYGNNDTLLFPYTVVGCQTITTCFYRNNDGDCNTISAPMNDMFMENVSLSFENLTGTYTQYLYTDSNGCVSFPTPSNDTYRFKFLYTNSTLTFTCNNPGNITTTGVDLNLGNIGVECNNSGYDLAITGNSWRTRPGTYGYAWLNYQKLTCLDYGLVSVSITLDPKLTYYSSYFTPSSIVGNTITWNNLNVDDFYYWSNYVSLVFETDISAQIGDSACFTATVSSINVEGDMSNNTYTWCSPIRNSWDPNDKAALPKGEGSFGAIPETTDELTYTINFQNLGNDTAFNVTVLDTLDANVNPNSFNIVSATSKMRVESDPAKSNIIRMVFNDINLTAASSNEHLSHGQVVYSVKLKSALPFGAQIKNTAHIYFDFNEAVVTNTTVNTITDFTLVRAFSNNKSLSVTPNPSKGNINIAFEASSENANISVVNTLGQECYNEKLSKLNGSVNHKLDLNKLNKGTYFVKVTNGNSPLNSVLIIE